MALESASAATRMLTGREGYQEWARVTHLALQERHPEASRYMFYDDIPPTEEVVEKRKSESGKIAEKCREDLVEPAEEDDDEDETDLLKEYKLHIIKYDRRTKLRSMVTSAMGFIQLKIASECVHTIKIRDEYVTSMANYDLWGFWNAIKVAMTPSGMAKAAGAAMVLIELISMKQQFGESVSVYSARHSKKREEVRAQNGIDIDGKIEANLFALSLNENYIDFQNRIKNSKDEDGLDYVNVREQAIRWTVGSTAKDEVVKVNAVVQPKVNVAVQPKVQSHFSKGWRNKKRETMECYYCHQKGHMIKDCKKLKDLQGGKGAIAAVAGGGNNGGSDQSKEYESDSNDSS
jgi:hypothetical protein